MQNYEEYIKLVEAAGFNSAQVGRRRERCPFVLGTVFREPWLQGWDEGVKTAIWWRRPEVAQVGRVASGKGKG